MSTIDIAAVTSRDQLFQQVRAASPAAASGLLGSLGTAGNDLVKADWKASHDADSNALGLVYFVAPVNPADMVIGMVFGFTDNGQAIAAQMSIQGPVEANAGAAGVLAVNACPAQQGQTVTAVLGGWVYVAATGKVSVFEFTQPIPVQS